MSTAQWNRSWINKKCANLHMAFELNWLQLFEHCWKAFCSRCILLHANATSVSNEPVPLPLDWFYIFVLWRIKLHGELASAPFVRVLHIKQYWPICKTERLIELQDLRIHSCVCVCVYVGRHGVWRQSNWMNTKRRTPNEAIPRKRHSQWYSQQIHMHSCAKVDCLLARPFVHMHAYMGVPFCAVFAPD